MPKAAQLTVKLIKTNIEKLAPASQEYEVADPEIRGLYLRIYPTGRKVFVLRYRTPGGQQRRFKLATVGAGTIPDKVREEAHTRLVAIREGTDPQATRRAQREGARFADFATRYLTEYVDVHCKPTTAYQHRWAIERHLVPALGSTPLAEIREAQLRRLLAKYNDTPTQANRFRQLLSGMFGKAADWGEVPEGFNPAAKIKKHREESRERFLTGEEMGRLFAAIDEEERLGGKKALGRVKDPEDENKLVEADSRGITVWQASLIRLLVFTGARLSEIKNCRWEWVNWKEGSIDLPDSKTGRKRIWLNAPAIEELRKLDNLPHGDFIIIGDDPDKPLVNATKAWYRTRERAGLKDVRLHDLRHSWASVSVTAAGANLPLVGAALGHRNPRTTARYAHVAESPVKALAERVATEIKAAVEAASKVKTIRKKDPDSEEAEVVSDEA